MIQRPNSTPRDVSLRPADGIRRGARALVGAVLLSGWGMVLVQANDARPDWPLLPGIQAHRTFLSDDLLEGRGTGTRGHALAAAYVASHFQRLGLVPQGDHGYLQTVPFVQGEVDTEKTRLLLVPSEGTGSANPVELAYAESFVAYPSFVTETTRLEAPLALAGFGVHAPEFGHDDFSGLDLRGKVAVIFSGAPSHLSTVPRAYYSSGVYKQPELVRRGAVGTITINTPSEEQRRPWATVLNGSRFPGMRWVGTDGTPAKSYPQLRMSARVGPRGVGALFDGSVKPLPEVLSDAEAGRSQGFDLPWTVRFESETGLKQVTSDNVLALLPGKDPQRASETIVVTAHLDHLGIGPEVNGDRIYNGAYDNAIGIGMLLELAARLAEGPQPLPRSVLFAAVTGEERGLLGSEYLAQAFPAGAGRPVANINLDMVLALHPTDRVAAIGADHSTLGRWAQVAANRTGITLMPDPNPQEVVFIRSDQFSFVQKGVPALFPILLDNPDLPAGAMTSAQFRRQHYHKPSDDIQLPYDAGSASRFVHFIAELVRETALAPELPDWLPDDFLGGKFGTNAR